MGFTDQLRQFFAANEIAVRFLHGQSFFILGLAMAVQWRQRSRLELARALPWVSAFGLCQAVAIWAAIFLTVNASHFSQATLTTLHGIVVLLQLGAIISVLGFGLRLNEPVLPTTTTALFPSLVGGIGALGVIALRFVQPEPDFATAEALLRNTVLAPSALLVAYGLRQQTLQLEKPLRTERFTRAMRVVGISFALFALSDGVIAPASQIPWGSVLNETLIGVPIIAARTAIAATMAISFFIALDVFGLDADRVAQALRQAQALGAERERIGRELHDGTIQSVYAFGLMLDDAQHALQQVRTGEPEVAEAGLIRAERRIGDAMDGMSQTIADIRRYIYDLREGHGNEDLARGLIDIIAEFRMRTGLEVTWRVVGRPGPSFSAAQRHHVYQITREALSNIARHARASEISVTLEYASESSARTRVVIHDNGVGLTDAVRRSGSGLRNMRERARILEGALEVTGNGEGGTTVALSFEGSET